VLTQLLAPARLARLQTQSVIDGSISSNPALFARLIDRTVRTDIPSGLAGEVQQRINLLVIERLLMLAYGDAAVPETKAAARESLRTLSAWLASQTKRRASNATHFRLLADMIEKATRDQSFTRRSNVAVMPPGPPI
jgi:hypothetical protein